MLWGRRKGKPSRCFSAALGLLYMGVMATVWARGPQGCRREIIGVVEGILKDVSRMNSTDEGLYTPNVNDYKKCPASTLRCFAEESKVLVYLNPNLSGQLTRRLMSISQKDWEREHCPQCEVHRAEPLETFLRTLYGILQLWCDSADQGNRRGR
ncbi:hypothetical protein MATL_G00117050 [Megalops atlanticus]|uniref:Interleukin n=1 Tax=Megalops atlanticus TaxID=7932 RepID=A0A9D3T5D5_MEGAT|nr:hypothetical protein MATL_G00117050 [Megalops atlanticus]